MFILNFLDIIFSNIYFITGMAIVSFLFKLYLILAMLFYFFQSPNSKKLIFFTLVFFIGALIRDGVYVFYFIRSLLDYYSEQQIFTLIARLNWVMHIPKYYSLVLIFHYVTKQNIKVNAINIIYWIGNLLVSGSFLYLAIFKYNIDSASPETFYFEIALVYFTYVYLAMLLAPTFFKIIGILRSKTLPKILSKQLGTFSIIMVSHFLLEIISEKNLYKMFWSKFLPFERYTLLNISTILATYALYYCVQRMIGLRFMDLHTHVQSAKKFNFVNDFKHILEKLSYVTSVKELQHITQMFFKAAFDIPINHTNLLLRLKEFGTDQTDDTMRLSEQFLLDHYETLKEHKVLIKDELEFTNFYNSEDNKTDILNFLNKIDADIFVPIFELQNIVAYIIVKQNSRNSQLFSIADRDEMLVFTSYLSNIISILKNHNLEYIFNREKELREELYEKHQEINQYKESLRTFLKSKNDKVGLIFYKNNRVSFANQEAHEITGVDIHSELNHPLVITLKKLASNVVEYKKNQMSFAKSSQGEKLLLNGIVDPNGNGAIITINYPEVSALIRSQYTSIKDPTKWDYLLYLETNEAGKLINQIIPSNTESCTNLKISLLSTALSKKATLLNVIEDDIMTIVSLLNKISLRNVLHTLNISTAEKTSEIALKIFGINSLLDNSENAAGLLEKLNNEGTLFIQNLHLLSMATQDMLADYLINGYFTKLKSDHKIFSNVRIIVSSNKNLQNMVASNTFSKKLYNELNKSVLHMPSLSFVSDQEIEQLAYGYSEQLTKSSHIELNNKDIEQILHSRPVSLLELKDKVNIIMNRKLNADEDNIQSTKFDLAYHVDDPEISKVLRLGKNALKDSNLMSILWEKYKNQNKIAQLLGVNRSSINRRMQQYNLIEKA